MGIMEGLQNLLDPEDRNRKEERKRAYRESLKGPSVHSDISGAQAQAQAVAQEHFGVQNDAIAATNDVIAKEMQSRVNQQREMRRMAHAQEMERMRQENLMRRLKAEQDAQERIAQMKRDAERGIISRVTVDGKGNVTHG